MSKLSTLYLNNLVFSGVHGQTGRETTDPQHFQVDIEMELDISKARESDALIDTYDYKHAREVARTVIEDEHYILIEKIAYQIAKRICEDPKVFYNGRTYQTSCISKWCTRNESHLQTYSPRDGLNHDSSY